jgi:hydrogenase nickel incorporation protein HypA/HybF
MHELAIAQSMVEIIEATARVERVTRVDEVRLVVGALSAVDPQALRFCFDVVTRGTVAERAALEIATEAASAWCGRCGEGFAVSELPPVCARCGQDGSDLQGGTGIRIAQMEVA